MRLNETNQVVLTELLQEAKHLASSNKTAALTVYEVGPSGVLALRVHRPLLTRSPCHCAIDAGRFGTPLAVLPLLKRAEIE